MLHGAIILLLLSIRVRWVCAVEGNCAARHRAAFAAVTMMVVVVASSRRLLVQLPFEGCTADAAEGALLGHLLLLHMCWELVITTAAHVLLPLLLVVVVVVIKEGGVEVRIRRRIVHLC